MSRGMMYGLRRGLCGGRLLELPVVLARGPAPHAIECKRMVGDGLELRRRRCVLSVCTRRHLRGLKAQAERRVARRTHLAARAISVQPGGEFSTPGISSLRLDLGPRVGGGGLPIRMQIRTCASNRLRDVRLRFQSGNGRRTRPRFVVGPPLRRGSGKGLQWATANFSTQRTIHECQSSEIV